MKLALAFALLISTTAYAGDKELLEQLAKSRSPENVQRVESEQKSRQCTQNAKNFHKKGKAAVRYIEACMEENEAAWQYKLVNSK